MNNNLTIYILMIYRFVNDPNLNLNFSDDILYTPLRSNIDIDSKKKIKSNHLSNKLVAETSQTNEKDRGISIFSWFILITIIIVLLWYFYGGIHHHNSPIEINQNGRNLQLESPDYGTHMKYGIF